MKCRPVYCRSLFCVHLCRADLDPIYYCELLKTCDVKDDGDASITSFAVSPKSVVYGENSS